jgi:hypothetical protein
MPCDTYAGHTSGDTANDRAHNLERRVSDLESALCGLCQDIWNNGQGFTLHPQLQAWFEKHKRNPGCEAR